LNKVSFETVKNKYEGFNLNKDIYYNLKKNDKKLYGIETILNNIEFKLEDLTFSKKNSSKSMNKKEKSENTFMQEIKNDECEYILENKINEDSNVILIAEPLIKEDKEQIIFKNLTNDIEDKIPNCNEKKVYLMKSLSLINNSKDETLILDENFINLHLNSLKLELPEKEIFKREKAFMKPDNKGLKVKDVENLIINKEQEKDFNKSKRVFNILDNPNIKIQLINGNQYNNINVYKNYNLPISKFNDCNDNKNINNSLDTEENQRIKYKIKPNKMSSIAKSFSNNNNLIGKNEEKIPTQNDSNLYFPTRVKTRNSNFSNLTSNYKVEKYNLDCLSSRLNADNITLINNEALNIEITPEIKCIISNQNYDKNLNNNINDFSNAENRNEDKIIKENDLLKQIDYNFKMNKKEKETISVKNSKIADGVSRKSSNNNLKNILRILVVDDEKLVRRSQIKLITKYLERNKSLFEIEECEDGIECLYKIYTRMNQGIKYDIIITDETMNFMKGSFMAKILKKLISENLIDDIKIFMVTSYESENYADLIGIILEGVFTKPMSFNNIKKIFKFS